MKKNRINLINSIVFLTIVFAIGILNILNKQTIFSYNENRYLQTFPKFTVEKLFFGNFTTEFENYVQDQFVARNYWLLTKRMANEALLKLENNGVYNAGDDYLISQFILNDDSQLMKNIEHLNKLDLPLDLIIVENSCIINKDKLKPFSYNTNQDELLTKVLTRLNKKINYIDVNSDLKKLDNSFFKTDHHWNILGADSAYLNYCQGNNLKANNYTFKELSNNFLGTLGSKAAAFLNQKDSIYQINELVDFKLKVTYDGEKNSTDIFFKDNLNKKDQYTYYLDGNHSIVEIENHQQDNKQTLIIVKDSFAHIFIPFLVPHYQKIIAIDLRYYKASVKELLKQNKGAKLLVLYSLDNLSIDNNLALINN